LIQTNLGVLSYSGYGRVEDLHHVLLYFFIKGPYCTYDAFRLFAINCAMWTLSWWVFPHHLSYHHALCTLNLISEEIPLHAKVRVSGKFCHSGKRHGI
jgi:hypothetical protein